MPISGAPVIVYGYEESRRWVELRGSDRELLFLADGVQQWLNRILDPVIQRDATDEERLAFERQAEVSRYFGGVPRLVDEPAQQQDVGDQLAALRRRGCGF